MFYLQVLVCFFAFTLVQSSPARHGKNVNGLGVPISNPDARDIIPGKYIVVYNANVSDTAVELHQASVVSAMRKRGLDISSKLKTYSMTGWRAMALEAEDDGMVIDIANSAEVNYVEADTIVKTNALLVQSGAPAGLGRISHSAAGSTDYVFDSTAGAGIVAYVVDTGIFLGHSEFQGRATWGTNIANNVDTDENGHGSHVSGTIGGKTFGVAKSASLVAVKVLDADGAGTTSDTILGLQWVLNNATARGLAGKAVINMSLGGPKSTSVNSAISQLTRAGITCVVAAGNENQNAANDSPASAPSAITVGAIGTGDAKASFSNFGAGVDIFAPGVNVLSVGITSTTATATLSGTSMASPHVAGMAAYLMALEGLTTPASIVARMRTLAGTTGATVKGANSATTKLIAYNGNGL